MLFEIKKSKEIEAVEDAFDRYLSMGIPMEELITTIKRIINELNVEKFSLNAKVADKEEIITKLNWRLEMLAKGKEG